MALADEVKTRLGTTGRLVELSNPNQPNATAIDDTRLTAACTDVQALLEIEAGVAFDVTNALHVAVAIEGVIYILKKRSGVFDQAFKDAEESWKTWLGKLAEVTGRDRVSPISSSTLTASRDEGTDPIRPNFDPEQFRDLTLRGPVRGTDLDEDD